MPAAGLAQKIQGLVDDAVAKGAKVLAGGKLPAHLPGQFYPPTVLTNVNKSMEIWSEEVFGPVSVRVCLSDAGSICTKDWANTTCGAAHGLTYLTRTHTHTTQTGHTPGNDGPTVGIAAQVTKTHRYTGIQVWGLTAFPHG